MRFELCIPALKYSNLIGTLAKKLEIWEIEIECVKNWTLFSKVHKTY